MPPKKDKELLNVRKKISKFKVAAVIPSAADLRKLHRQVLQQMSKLSVESQITRIARERHLVLCDFVAHQELILYALQHDLRLPPHFEPSAGNSQPAAAATPGSSSNSNGPVASSYVADLLRNVSAEQLQQVASWTNEDDIKKLTQVLFHKLVALLELIERKQQQDEDEDYEWMQEENAAAAAAAAAAAGDDAKSVGSNRPRSRGNFACAVASGSGSNSGTQIPPPPAAAAAAAQPELTSAAVAAAIGGAKECLAMLEQVIDNAVTLTCVGLVFNCRAIVDCALTHQMHSKPVPIVAPQAHWKHVVNRLNLTADQLLLLRIAADEYTRLVLEEQVAGKALLEKAAMYLPSTSLALRSVELDTAIATAVGAACSVSSAADVPADLGANRASTVSVPDSSAPATVCTSRPIEATAPPTTAVQGGAASAGADPAAAAAAAGVIGGSEQDGPDPDLGDLFKKHLDLRVVHMTVLSFFLLNTLSKVQIAKVISAAVAEAAGDLHRQQEQKQKQQQQPPTAELWAEQSQENPKTTAVASNPAHSKAKATRASHEQLHTQQRRAGMQQQMQRWWYELGAEPPYQPSV